MPEGVDPGWSYAPGRSVAERTRATVERKRSQLPDALGAAMMTEIRSHLREDPEELE